MRARDLWQRLRWILALVLLCSLATCPAAVRSCSTRRAAGEAPALLGYLVERVKAYAFVYRELPDVDVGPTPAIGACCATGDTCAPDPKLWTAPGWRLLRFSIDDPHRFAYEVHRDGEALVLTATGNQDCDSVHARHEVRLTLEGKRVIAVWTQTNPLE